MCWRWALDGFINNSVSNPHSLINKLKFRAANRNSLLPKSGLFHFDYQEHGERSRIHLRIDPDGSALLLVNASRIMHLNPTATAMVYLILHKTPQKTAIDSLSRAFDAPTVQILDDYTQTVDQLHELIKPDGACPTMIELEVTPPLLPAHLQYRMDRAVTYRCNNDWHCIMPRDYP
jgi:hypothetical protein